MEELRYERNAVQLVTSSFRQHPIAFHKSESHQSTESSLDKEVGISDVEKSGLTLVMMLEWCGGGSVQDLVDKQHDFLSDSNVSVVSSGSLPERVVVSVIRAVCNPLLKMHNRYGSSLSHYDIHFSERTQLSFLLYHSYS